MPEGTITRLVSEQGVGYIQPDGQTGSSNDRIFYRSEAGETAFEEWQVGQRVTYDLEPDARRGAFKATHVRPLAPA